MKEFYQISHNNGQDKKVIIANTSYEAIGFYLTREVKYINSESLDRVKTLQPYHEIEVYCNGVPVKKKIFEIWEEKSVWSTPYLVISLVKN